MEIDQQRIETRKSLSDGSIAGLLLASSLSATVPLVSFMKFMIQERIINKDRFVPFIKSALGDREFPPETKAMLDPIWNSLLQEIEKVD